MRELKQVKPLFDIRDHHQVTAQSHVSRFLESMGQDISREGLKDTPKRYAKFFKEFVTPAPFVFRTFKNEGHDEMIVVKQIPFYSLCEHHLAPFFGTAAIAYLPGTRIVGLSKIPRVLDLFARQPQNQERITTQVADFLMKELKPKGVGVHIEARHLCVEMRGVEKPGTITVTSCLLGKFKQAAVRNEFLNLIK